MNFSSTFFLKLVVFLIGIPVFAMCIWMLWLMPVNPVYDQFLYPIMAGLFLSTIPFYIALFQAFKLLSYIDRKQAFSLISVTALGKIKFCALTISGLYVVLMPFVFFLADKDDAPGLVLFGTIPIFASVVIAVFSAVLQRLLQDAIEIKSENDLTV